MVDENGRKLARQIRGWMVRNVERFIDECNEVNATAMVEAWDTEIAGGGDTLDSDHVAWEIAAEIAIREDARLARVSA
jgi:hypothetical protein